MCACLSTYPGLIRDIEEHLRLKLKGCWPHIVIKEDSMNNPGLENSNRGHEGDDLKSFELSHTYVPTHQKVSVDC